MNVAFLGVLTAQAVPALLASLIALVGLGLVALWGIGRIERATGSTRRRVVLHRVAVPVHCRQEPALRSALLDDLDRARAPPTFPSGRRIADDRGDGLLRL
jgi:hypothetical protein